MPILQLQERAREQVSASNGVLNFDDPEPISIPVKIGKASYTLREATGDAACKYQNAQSAAYEYGPDGSIRSIRGMADVEPLLVSLCLFDDRGNPVGQDVVRGWKAPIQRTLYQRAKEISELDRDETIDSLDKQIARLQARRDKLLAEDPAKNGQSGSTAG